MFTAMATSLGFDAIVISVAVRAYCGRMATEGVTLIAQCVDMLRIGVMRDVYVHANMEQHH